MNEHHLTFDADYEEIIELGDGTPVRLEPLGPEDRDKLERGFERLSTESRYRRFLSPKPRLSDAEVGYLTDIDQQNHLAIGATLVEGEHAGDGIAVARCVRLDEQPRIAEAAVTVVDDFQGRGLGSMMLDRLVDAAHDRGITTFRASLFTENKPMRLLLEKIGPVEVVDRSGSVVTVDVSLEEEDEPQAGTPQEGGNQQRETTPTPLGKILSLTARGIASLADKIRPDSPESE